MVRVSTPKVRWSISIFLIVLRAATGVLAANGSATYLLITNAELAPAFQTLVDRRTTQGFTGKLITVESISAHYSGVDTPEKIRNCLRDHYLNHGTLYVALGGDDVVVPVRYCDPRSNSFEMPADLYYSDMDGGDWDKNHNGIYGQLGDVDEIELTPDIHLGRIPVRTVENAIAYIDKVVIYETAEPDGFANSMIVFGAWGFISGDARRRDFRHHDPVSGAEFHQMYTYYRFIQPYWQPVPLHFLWDLYSSWDTNRCGDYALTLDNLSERLNRAYHFVFYWGHSAPGAWGMGWGRRFTAERAAALTNPIPSIVLSFACSPAHFDSEGICLSEAFLQNPNGGAVVYFGHTRSAGGGHKDCEQLFLEMFREGAKTVGEAMTQVLNALAPGHVSDPYEQYNFTLQGDPCIQFLREENGRHLQIFQPKGCEVIQRGTDFYIRWNAAGADFMPDEKVKLEYSANSGRTWHAVRRAEDLRYNKEVFIWDKCLLPVGSNYRIKVTSLTDPAVSDMSGRDFTIGEPGILTVKSSPVNNVVIEGGYDNVIDYYYHTDFNVNILNGTTVNMTAPLIPEGMSEWEFTRWSDEAGNTLSDTQDYTFTFINDMTIVAEYIEPIKLQYYVNDELPENGISAGDDNNDGDKPQQPMRHIQALLDKYPNLGERSVINISAGTYEENISLDDENAGIVLLGAGQDVTIIDGKQNGSCISLNGCSNGVISGLTIRNGSVPRGGGIYCSGSSPMIKECTFIENAAEGKGGAIFTEGSSSPEIFDCIFIRNSGKSGGAVCNWNQKSEIKSCLFEANHARDYGGAIHILSGRGVSQVLDCVFVNNTARNYGGGLYLDRSEVEVSHCIFEGNSTRDGGALCNYGGNARIKFCTFKANRAGRNGGAVNNRHGCSPSFSNCIFYTNEGQLGGAMATMGDQDNANVTNCTFSRNHATENGGALYVGYNKCTTATNCILWGNTPEQIIGESSVSYCNVQGDWPGEGNIDADPLFADPENGDYHLKSQAGRWDSISQSWVVDDVTSPCIDAGDPSSPIGLEPLPNGDIINIGAYGGTAEASKSP